MNNKVLKELEEEDKKEKKQNEESENDLVNKSIKLSHNDIDLEIKNPTSLQVGIETCSPVQKDNKKELANGEGNDKDNSPFGIGMISGINNDKERSNASTQMKSSLNSNQNSKKITTSLVNKKSENESPKNSIELKTIILKRLSSSSDEKAQEKIVFDPPSPDFYKDEMQLSQSNIEAKMNRVTDLYLKDPQINLMTGMMQ